MSEVDKPKLLQYGQEYKKSMSADHKQKIKKKLQNE